MVPGVILYFFFGMFILSDIVVVPTWNIQGIIAGATGIMLSYMYNQLDSDRYPVRT